MKKILFSDFDSTLYVNKDIPKENIDAINSFRERGNLFVIATGRSFVDLERKLEVYPINFDYLIIGHGSVILNRNKEVIKAFTIDSTTTKMVIDSLDEFKLNIIDYILFDCYRSHVDINSNQITKIMIRVKDLDNARKISVYLNNKYNRIIKSYVIVNSILVEVTSANTDKSEAIKEVIRIENVDKSNVYTIGDASNDLEMIRDYNGFGMVNSEQEVKDAAKKLYNNVYDLINDII